MSDEARELNLTGRMIPMKGGKHYLQVADRIVWFREEYPEGTIETQLVELDREKQFCMYRARVTTGKGGVAEASGTETARDFGDYIEKAETKAVGRALGYLGFGTASAGFEEGQRVVDAPRNDRRAEPAPPPARPRQEPSAPAQGQQQLPASDIGLQRASERQVKFIYGIAREAGLDDQELTAWSQELYQQDVEQLNRRDASTLIEALQRRRNEVA
jgi:hypothetical protein